jgi:3-oxoacyl-[acyl-carrier protein] reductase
MEKKMLEGQTALITGGTAGIGKAIAKLFLEHGANVILFGRNAQRGEEALEELRPSGDGKLSFRAVDVANLSAVKENIASVLEEFSQIDILVNNAGITKDGLLMKMKEDDWDSVIDINLKSVYNLCHSLARHMMKARKGKIINISSVGGVIGNPGQANYCASKAGVIGITKSLAKELAPRNIYVNCVAPGFVETQMTDVLSEKQQASLKEQIPLGRIGNPEEIACAVLFLASGLSSYITGQVLSVDGGMVM